MLVVNLEQFTVPITYPASGSRLAEKSDGEIISPKKEFNH